MAKALETGFETFLWKSRFIVILAVTASLAMAAEADQVKEPHALLHERPAAGTGNPAFDPSAPPRLAEPGRLLLSCIRPGEPHPIDIYASARDFDEGKQSFYLRRWNRAEAEMIYPLHGHFLDDGDAGIFMVHDGKGTRQSETILIDQTVNMGLVFIRTTREGLRAILNIYAENDSAPAGLKDFEEFACRWGEQARRRSFDKDHVHATPNSGALPPSHWYRESDSKLLACGAAAPTGEYRIEVLGSTIWPGHLAFLVVRAPGGKAVGYNVHLLEGPGRLLVHAHSYPHRTRLRMMDTMEETETVIGGLLLRKTEDGYTGWVGLVASASDPQNISFSRDASVGDYAALGHAVIPPLPVRCK